MAKKLLGALGDIASSFFGFGNRKSSNSSSKSPISTLISGNEGRSGSAYHRTFINVKTPTKDNTVSTASMSSLDDRLDRMLEVVTNLVEIEQKNVASLIDRENKDANAHRESLLESRKSSQIVSSGGPDYGFDSIFKSFSTSISELISRIDDLEVGGSRNRGGLLGGLLSGAASGIDIDIGSDDRENRRNRRRTSNSRTGTQQSSTRQGASQTTRRVESNLARSASKSLTKNEIRTIARPIITRALGRTVLKSIPVAGILAGLAFGVSRLATGDLLGAGLEVASSVGGPATAVPAFIVSIARDIYTSTYGVEPEKDPDSGERLRQITDEVTDIARDALSSRQENSSSGSRPITPVSSSSGGSFVASQQSRVMSPSTTSGMGMSPMPPSSSGSGGSSVSPASQPQAPQASVSSTETPQTKSLSQSSGSMMSREGETVSPSGSVNSNALMPHMEAPPEQIRAEETQRSVETNLSTLMEKNQAHSIKASKEIPNNLTKLSMNRDILQTQKDSHISVSIPQASYITPTSPTPRSEPSRVGTGNVPDPNYYPAFSILSQMYFEGV